MRVQAADPIACIG